MKEQDTNPTHSFLIEDVAKYGSIEKALIIKEIRGMQLYKMRHGANGWVYYSASALEKKFPYMNPESIRRWVNELVKDGSLEMSVQNKVKFDKTKSFRLPDLHVPQNVESTPQNVDSQSTKYQLLIPQNVETIPSHSSHSSHSAGAPAFEGGRPDNRGKESPNKERIRKALRSRNLGALRRS